VFGYAETLGASDRFAVILLGNEELGGEGALKWVITCKFNEMNL
jgi:hypothetical protein